MAMHAMHLYPPSSVQFERQLNWWLIAHSWVSTLKVSPIKMKMHVVECCLLMLLLCAADGVHCYRPTTSDLYTKFKENAASRKHKAGANASLLSSANHAVFYPTRYGADPTGQNDSSDAFLKVIEDAFNIPSSSKLLPGVKDLGGVQIDLEGGDYKISKPLRFPANGGGNVVIQGGTIRASQGFPADGYLIEQWSTSSAKATKTAQIEDLTEENVAGVGIYYEDITYRDLLLDCGYRGGGLLVIDSARTRIENCFVIHFMTDGILVERGHETYISSSFLGQHLTVGGDPGERNFSGTAINLASNDNALTDIAIFSAATGVILRGQANILTGVHCYNKATGWGGIGVLVKLAGLAQTRIDNCYMDYTGIVVEDPVQFHVSNTFFLGDANVKLKSVSGKVSGLNIVDNMFSGSNNGVQIVVLDESSGPFKKIEQVVVDRNNVNGMKMKSTVARKTAAGNSTSWTVNFSSDLIFPARITHVGYSLTVKGTGEIPAHAIGDVVNNTVTVRTNNPVNGIVSVFVDQFALPGEVSPYLYFFI